MEHFIIGLTGGIGSGKSTVATAFAERGISLVDTDIISRNLTGPGGKAMPALIKKFGPEIALADGGLNREIIREKVFSDQKLRHQLESTLHPLIRSEAQRLLLEQQKSGKAKPYQILIVPLLLETGNHWEVDRILVVDCPVSLQIERVIKRNGFPRSHVEKIINAQATQAHRLAQADDVIDNSGDHAQLIQQVALLHARYAKLAAQKAHSL